MERIGVTKGGVDGSMFGRRVELVLRFLDETDSFKEQPNG